MKPFKDVLGRELMQGDHVAFATTQHPGRSKHAILKVGKVKYIKQGKSGPYVYVQFVDEDGGVTSAVARESDKLCRLAHYGP